MNERRKSVGRDEPHVKLTGRNGGTSTLDARSTGVGYYRTDGGCHPTPLSPSTFEGIPFYELIITVITLFSIQEPLQAGA